MSSVEQKNSKDLDLLEKNQVTKNNFKFEEDRHLDEQIKKLSSSFENFTFGVTKPIKYIINSETKSEDVDGDVDVDVETEDGDVDEDVETEDGDVDEDVDEDVDDGDVDEGDVDEGVFDFSSFLPEDEDHYMGDDYYDDIEVHVGNGERQAFLEQFVSNMNVNQNTFLEAFTNTDMEEISQEELDNLMKMMNES